MFYDEHLLILSFIPVGLRFIESNVSSATDEVQQSPVGFDIIFPSLIQSAMNLGINLPLGDSTLATIFHMRDFELQRYDVFLGF